MNQGGKKKIVILGGGFGGLYTYLSLRKQFKKNEVDITIVNRTNYFLFTPLLHEIATGSVSHHQVVESLRQIIYKSNASLHVAEILSVDCDRKVVKTSIAELPYDILVVALGATTNFFDAPGAEENSFVLKDLRDAISLRTALIEAFEKASEIKDPVLKKKELSFVIVGGGSTGVELVSETADLFLTTFSKYYKKLIKPSEITLTLINRGPEILAPFHPRLRRSALRVLQNSGIKVMLNTGVKEVRTGGIVLDDGSFVEANLVVWTAGVKPNVPAFTHPVEKDQGGRVVITNTLQIPNSPNVFVLGDMASLPGKDGKPLPMLAQVAVRQGKQTGENIKRLLQGEKLVPFKYKSQGELVSLGQWHAVANIRGIKFRGAFAWFLWRTIYLFKFLSFSKKLKIAVDWTINIFYPRDITKA
jgi:NADH:ubiquinone reductase (H+-translocating)